MRHITERPAYMGIAQDNSHGLMGIIIRHALADDVAQRARWGNLGIYLNASQIKTTAPNIASRANTGLPLVL